MSHNLGELEGNGSGAPKITLIGRIEAAVCFAAVVSVVVTLITPDWIETVFGVDPDHANSAFEWALTFAIALVAVITGVLATRECRRLASVEDG